MKVRVNPILCKAKRTCNEVNPEIFHLDVWSYAYVAEGMEDVPEELKDKARAAYKACPEGAIVLEE
ncbi:MAG: ferredoxin [Candidatus Binatia bacterium]